MALMAPNNWTLTSYTNGVWTDLVAVPAVVTAITIVNTSASAVNVELRLEDSGTSLATLLPSASVAAGTSYTFDSGSLTVKGAQAIQVRADAVGIEFMAAGAA